MDMRDIFSVNAADFSVPMRNSLLFPACRAYAMPVAKLPFEVFRKASISAAKQLRLFNKGNKITTGGGTQRLCISRLVRKGCQSIFASGNCLFPEKSIFCIPHLRHAATRWRRLSYIPGTVPRMSMLCPQVSGAFCIQQQTDKPNMNI